MPGIPDTTTPARRAAMARQGAALKAARATAGLSQPRAAEALGVPTWTYRSWEHGRRGAPLAARRRVVKEWGGDPLALATGDDCCPTCGRPTES